MATNFMYDDNCNFKIILKGEVGIWILNGSSFNEEEQNQPPIQEKQTEHHHHEKRKSVDKYVDIPNEKKKSIEEVSANPKKFSF